MQGVWADPVSKDVAQVFQAWAVLEQRHGTLQLARELFKCAVKADPQSQTSWAVRHLQPPPPPPPFGSRPCSQLHYHTYKPIPAARSMRYFVSQAVYALLLSHCCQLL